MSKDNELNTEVPPQGDDVAANNREYKIGGPGEPQGFTTSDTTAPAAPQEKRIDFFVECVYRDNTKDVFRQNYIGVRESEYIRIKEAAFEAHEKGLVARFPKHSIDMKDVSTVWENVTRQIA